MSESRCENCMFFVPDARIVVGQCHRFPPEASGQWGFPEIGRSLWCGEWRAEPPTRLGGYNVGTGLFDKASTP